MRETVVEKVWLIREIGNMLQGDTRVIEERRKKIKQKVSHSFRKYNRKVDKLLNLINEEGSSLGKKESNKLKDILR